MSGITAGALLGAAGIGAAGMLGAAAIGKQKPMQQGYDVVYPKQYSYTEPMLQGNADFLMRGQDYLSRGEAPPWYDALANLQKRGLLRDARQSTFGRAGERYGAMETAKEWGANLGLGSGQTYAQGRRAMNDYQDRLAQIDEYMAGLKMGYMTDAEKFYPSAIMQMPRGPEYQVVNMMGGVSGSQQAPVDLSGFGSALGAYLANRPQKTTTGQTGTGGFFRGANTWSSPAVYSANPYGLGTTAAGPMSQTFGAYQNNQLSGFTPDYNLGNLSFPAAYTGT